MNPRAIHPRRGLTLIEVILFMFLSMVLVVGVTSALGQSRRLAGAAAQRAKLALLATEELDRLRALAPDALDASLGRRELPDGPVVFVLESSAQPHASGLRELRVAASSVEADPPAPVAVATLVEEAER
ncbi:MAG: hypothetical protein SF028_03795 [Candidatus Sumerlaeia bacterium]|nr:hypothetical protein [Candidatus Sumerlaeia bacterium]